MRGEEEEEEMEGEEKYFRHRFIMTPSQAERGAVADHSRALDLALAGVLPFREVQRARLKCTIASSLQVYDRVLSFREYIDNSFFLFSTINTSIL